MKRWSGFRVMAVLAVFGAVISGMALRNHYVRGTSSFCNISQTLNCDVVNRSEYSEVLGIPVALIGLLGYVALLGLATVYREKAETPAMLLFSSITALAFSLYLTYVEAHILATYCILCLGSLAVIVLISLLAARETWMQVKG